MFPLCYSKWWVFLTPSEFLEPIGLQKAEGGLFTLRIELFIYSVVSNRAADPHHFNADPDQAFQFNAGSGSDFIL